LDFTRRYLLWLLLPPAVVTLPLSLIFVQQIVHPDPREMVILLSMVGVIYAVGAYMFRVGMRPFTEAVTEAVEHRREVGESMSRCLAQSKKLSIWIWGGGGLLIAIAATIFVMPTPLGFAYFIVATLIAAFPAVAWGYVEGKRQLLNYTRGAAGIRYTGSEFPLGRKIALTFIGLFIVSSVALVQLVSSEVSTTLEELAIASAQERFERTLNTAETMPVLDASHLAMLQRMLPAEDAVHLIAPDGHVGSTGEALTPFEIYEVRRLKTGDSVQFISPHVSRFAQLRNGSILVLSIPWSRYRAIPMQIALYTLIIALLTTAIFAVAALTLARDITAPLHELRELARLMAQGDFVGRASVFSDDEVGQLAASFGETNANLQRLLARVGGSGATITDGVRVITGGTSRLLDRSRDQANLTESSSLAVENVRGGISSVLHAADTVAELTQDASSRALELQSSSEEIARSMDHLFQSVEKTSSSTTEMNASTSSMSNRTDVLAGIGEEVLSFVSQMDATIGELRESSQLTAEISRQVREDAEGGGAAVERTVQGINTSRDLTNETANVLDTLQQSVGQITQILSVIEEVTNRTNLLALNAAIIAAQAGEHGLGFTVVADEIRELAERTRGSTKEIAAIIKAVQSGSREAVSKMHEGVTRVEENVQLATHASSSLSKIVGSATRSYEAATKISRALEDQARASRHLHEVTSRMSDHIVEIHRGMGEQVRGTQLLAEESERVREIALQVKNATNEQTQAGRGITEAVERMSDDARAMRDLLERQLNETAQIADASKTMLEIAQQNDAIAHEFNDTVQNLVRSGSEFETEVGRFRFRA
jgi:methyl-accepting chemotaxis protein